MSFTAYAMPCTQEQFEKDLEPTLKRWGVEIKNLSNFDEFPHIINNYGKLDRPVVTNGYLPNCIDLGATLIPYNPAKFLDSLFPEKWCVRDTKEVRIFLNKISKLGLIGDCSFFLFEQDDVKKDRLYTWDGIQLSFSDSTDYTEVTLEELIYHYEQPKEEVMKKQKFVRLIENNVTNLTTNKQYLVEKEEEEYYYITDDKGSSNCPYFKSRFKVVCDSGDNLTITRTQLKEIYDIACDWWKTKIVEYGKRLDLVTDTITFTESEVQAMFKAAVEEQPKVLERIFGNPRIAELKARKEELEAELEGINKELNLK